MIKPSEEERQAYNEVLDQLAEQAEEERRDPCHAVRNRRDLCDAALRDFYQRFLTGEPTPEAIAAAKIAALESLAPALAAIKALEDEEILSDPVDDLDLEDQPRLNPVELLLKGYDEAGQENIELIEDYEDLAETSPRRMALKIALDMEKTRHQQIKAQEEWLKDNRHKHRTIEPLEFPDGYDTLGERRGASQVVKVRITPHGIAPDDEGEETVMIDAIGHDLDREAGDDLVHCRIELPAVIAVKMFSDLPRLLRKSRANVKADRAKVH